MKLRQSDELAAVLDACVLAPMPLCDTLLRCAETPPLFRVLWSSEILREVRRTLEKFGYSGAQADRRVLAMEEAFPEAKVRISRRVLSAVPDLPDPRDQHVVAAAIAGHARAIVTFNLRHFPHGVLKAQGLLALSPDEFLAGLFRRDRQRVVEVLDEQARAIGETKFAVLERLRVSLPKFASIAAEE